MPLPADILTQLADVLAELYSDHASARTMATTAGVPVERIPVDDKPHGYWVNLLQEAENRGLTQAVLDRATAQYPTNPALAAVRQAYSAWALPPLPPRDLPDEPFRYLDWYHEEHAEVFFGRGPEIRKLLDRVTAADGPPIILLYGQSGVGKSSLLEAGLIPRLKSNHAVRKARRDQDKGLAGTLAGALGAAPGDDLPAVWHRLEEEGGQPLVVILDQVEEVYTRANLQQPNELADFLDALEDLFADAGGRPRGRLILSLRKEWLADIKERLVERSLPRGEVFVERLGRAGIADVVAGPQSSPRLRAHYGLEVATALPGLIADDLLADRESPVAPMLAILLTDMWDAAKKRSHDHPMFDEDLYHEFRSRGLSLDDFLGRQLRTLHDQLPEVVDSGLALDVLAYHTTPLGTAAQRSLADLKATYSHRQDVLPALVEQFRSRYLLVDPSQNQPDQPLASRLAHDTLAPHVRKRFDESDAPGQRARRILESRAVDWTGGREGAPLDEADLAWVEAGENGMRCRNPDEDRLVQVSMAARVKRQEEQARITQEREDARRREKEDAHRLRNSNKRLTGALAFLIVLVVIAVVLVVIAVVLYWYADERITIGQNLLRIQGNFLAEIETRGVDRQAIDLYSRRLQDAQAELRKLVPARHQLPDLTGLPLDEARAGLANLCQPTPCLDMRLRWETSEQVARGSVIRSDPAASARLYWGTPVTLTVSMGSRAEIDDLIDIDLVHVPAGEFTVGSDPSLDPMSKPDESLPAKVSLPGFSIGRYEITNDQYAVFAQAPGNDIRKPWDDGRFPPGMERHPVVEVSWYDAVRYTQWLSDLTGKPYRLCTEVEWEKACRGTEGRLYPWGSVFDEKYLNFEGTPGHSTTPVGKFSQQGDSPYGAADMAGNVFEWTSSLFASDNQDGGREIIFEPGERVQRGGSFASPADGARCAARFNNYPGNHFNNHGFRVCMSSEP